MDIILQSLLLVFLGEMGDKTQLLTLILVAKYRKPIPILMGILVATLLNHFIASYFGHAITHMIPQHYLRWILSVVFIGFGLWILVPDKDGDLKKESKWGPFLTTTFVFFLAEMGDKTQLATVALGARFSSPLYVTIGTTLGMLLADGLALILGHKLADRIPLNLIRKITCAIFIFFGIGILFW